MSEPRRLQLACVSRAPESRPLDTFPLGEDARLGVPVIAPCRHEPHEALVLGLPVERLSRLRVPYHLERPCRGLGGELNGLVSVLSRRHGRVDQLFVGDRCVVAAEVGLSLMRALALSCQNLTHRDTRQERERQRSISSISDRAFLLRQSGGVAGEDNGESEGSFHTAITMAAASS